MGFHLGCQNRERRSQEAYQLMKNILQRREGKTRIKEKEIKVPK